MIKLHPQQSGFTIIEMIVSLAVFSIVITTAVGSLLLLVASNRQLQEEQVIMTNLSFALDSMTREIRTGIKYFCLSASPASINSGVNRVFNPAFNIDTILSTTTSQDCFNGIKGNPNNSLAGISFVEGGGSLTGTAGRILYYYDRAAKVLYRRVGGSAPQSIVSSDISIEDFDIFVSGEGNADRDQPTVTLFIEASRNGDPGGKLFRLQTTITQRTLDV